MFNAWSYADQLKKYHPERAESILKGYGWRIEKVSLTERICERCNEEYMPRAGRQKYCTKNSKGDNCSRIAKYEKLYKKTTA